MFIKVPSISETIIPSLWFRLSFLYLLLSQQCTAQNTTKNIVACGKRIVSMAGYTLPQKKHYDILEKKQSSLALAHGLYE